MINIQNIDDNECFKLSKVRYLNPADHHQARIKKAEKDFAKKNWFFRYDISSKNQRHS